MKDSSSRPSPSQSATLYKEGTKKKGNDGNTWIVAETVSGVKRWKLHRKPSKTTPPKKATPPKKKETPKTEKLRALRALAKLHPSGGVDHIYGFGRWKNPLNPQSKGIRWTPTDLDIFRTFQSDIKKK